jgi:hypothetical protein
MHDDIKDGAAGEVLENQHQSSLRFRMKFTGKLPGTRGLGGCFL